MYEMEGPRPVSRHRPADFSASIAPLDYLPGPGTLPVFRSRPDHRVARGPRAAARALPFANKPGFPPSPLAPGISLTGWLRAFFHQLTGVSPKPKGSSFPFADRLRAFFSARDSGLPLRHSLKSLPFAGWLRGSPSRVSPFAGWHQAFPEARGPKVSRDTGWSGVSPAPLARSFLLAGSAGPLLAEARSFPLPGGSGFPFAGSRPWWYGNFYAHRASRTRGFGQQFQDSLAVHKPSTVNPQLSPATGRFSTGYSTGDPQAAAPRCPGAGQASPG